MRADRLLSAVLHLQANGRLSGRELAERLEVSARTVHRDMEALSAAGVPVYALRGAQGGWQLDGKWSAQVPGLDEAEVQALLMAQPRVMGDARLAAAAESALLKLMAALPDALRARAASIRQRLHVDTTGWRGATENLTMLPVVQDAVARDRKLEIHYRAARGERTKRTVDPLGLVAKGSAWYLYARTPRGYRTFRISRIELARVLDKPCKRPASFDLAARWKSSAAELQDRRPPYEAVLRLEESAAEWVMVWQTASPVHEAGSRTLRVQFHHPDEALFVVLGLGSRVEVVSPASLRERAAREIAAVVARRGVQ